MLSVFAQKKNLQIGEKGYRIGISKQESLRRGETLKGGISMNIWHDISEERIYPTDFMAVIEIEKGSNKKYELDKETGMLSLDRILFTATHYPMNYGFIPRTYGDDKDPLDVLVLCSESILPMTLVRCYPIGVMKMEDGGMGDEKIIAIPYGDPTYMGYTDIHELPKHIFEELKHFFTIYKHLEGKSTTVNEFGGPIAAVEVIAKCMENGRSCGQYALRLYARRQAQRAGVRARSRSPHTVYRGELRGYERLRSRNGIRKRLCILQDNHNRVGCACRGRHRRARILPRQKNQAQSPP